MIGPVLPGFEELVNGPGEKMPQGQPVAQDTHPPLQQALTEAVGPLGVADQREGGVHPVDHILLYISGGLDTVNVHVLYAPAHLVHGIRVGDPL